MLDSTTYMGSSEPAGWTPVAPKSADGLRRDPAPGGEDAAVQTAPVIRVLIADAHPLMRQGIRALLQGCPDMLVLGEAEGAEQALAFVAQRQVDIVVMEARMPGMGGIDATRRLRATYTTLRVLILTAHPECAREAFLAGASGYMLKSAHGQALLAAIRSVYYGATVIPDGLGGDVTLSLGAPRAPLVMPFTPREMEVLHLMARGLTNRAIARELGIGPRTADQHVHNIFIKAGVRSRTGAVRYALEHHLTDG